MPVARLSVNYKKWTKKSLAANKRACHNPTEATWSYVMPLSSRVAAIADDIPPLDAAYWQRRYEVERAAMKRAWEGGDLDYAIKNAKIYWRVEANAIGWASRPVPKPEPLTTECPRCESGTAFAGNHPGGGSRCEVCDGEGVVPLVCDLCGDYGATELVGGRPFHDECAEEWRADAFWVSEDAL